MSSTTPYAVIQYDYIHHELSKKGVTLTLLWNEYCEHAYANGETLYMNTQLGDKYRRCARITKATMRVTHKPGETMQVNWAGGTIPYFDPRSPVKSTGHTSLLLRCLAAAISMSKPAQT